MSDLSNCGGYGNSGYYSQGPMDFRYASQSYYYMEYMEEMKNGNNNAGDNDNYYDNSNNTNTNTHNNNNNYIMNKY